MIRPRRWSSFGISWLIEKMPKILWWDTEENLLEMEEDDIEKGAFNDKLWLFSRLVVLKANFPEFLFL